jgi:hypothetical protein
MKSQSKVPARASHIQALVFDKKKFDREQAIAWAKDHDFRTTDVTSNDRTIRIRQSALRDDETEYRAIKLTDGVRGVLEITMLGKYALEGAGNGGGSPALQDSALPDFKTIYYQPEDAEAVKRDEEQQMNRRRALARQNSGRFGLHGATTPEPQVRYHPGDYPAVTRGQANEPAGRAPKLVVRGSDKRILQRKGSAS